MKVAVTGAAGFIGSHLTAELLRLGHEVCGVDSLTDYYERSIKIKHLEFSGLPAECFLEKNVGDLEERDLAGVDVVVHLAAQPGVRDSWQRFDDYVDNNLKQTNSLAALCRLRSVPRMVFASSSSVYGDAASYPTGEDSEARPRSPYGVSKLAAEHLLEAHSWASDLDVMLLRFFTVYGPGQRPDMAIQRLIQNAMDPNAEPFVLFGDGEQRRDFTFVGDLVRALVAAIDVDLPDAAVRLNLGGSGDVSINQLIALVGQAVGKSVKVRRVNAQPGDVLRTGANAKMATDLLGWTPVTAIDDGVRRQANYVRDPSRENWSTGPSVKSARG